MGGGGGAEPHPTCIHWAPSLAIMVRVKRRQGQLPGGGPTVLSAPAEAGLCSFALRIYVS